MLNLRVIEQTDSAYTAPVVLVSKKDGSTRFCIDYRRLNNITVFYPEPMNQPVNIFAKLASDKYYTKIDMAKGYWQISVASEDQSKTVFSTPDQGNFHFTKMRFELVNSAATFTRMKRKLLKGLDVDSHIDDLLIHTPPWEGHLEALRSLLQRLRESRLTAKLRKRMFGYPQVDYVGHKVGQSQVCMSDDNVAKIKQLEKPNFKRQLRSVLGLANYYRDHIPHFSHLAAPLTALTKKGSPNTLPWDDTHQTDSL